jgi:type I restriction enzyme R subunit
VKIFGRPVFVYSYREAVVDGYQVDHEPPFRIRTALSSEGIRCEAGEAVKTYGLGEAQIEPFNRVVCEQLANELDPFSRQKTLIFCATDRHADLVVQLLAEAFQVYYGSLASAWRDTTNQEMTAPARSSGYGPAAVVALTPPQSA